MKVLKNNVLVAIVAGRLKLAAGFTLVLLAAGLLSAGAAGRWFSWLLVLPAAGAAGC